MATVHEPDLAEDLDYPTSDGRPVAETDKHRNSIYDLLKMLEANYAGEPLVYVSGNLIICYERGDRRKHVAPDVFVVKGVRKRERNNYLIWQERRGPNVVFEATSQSTWQEDIEHKFEVYQNIIKVPEYFLFDPLRDYLNPPLQSYRLRRGRYERIEPVNGRLRSEQLGLVLEAKGTDLRLYDPKAARWLPTPEETARLLKQEVERLRRENEELRRPTGKKRGRKS